jgi:ubiquinone biosynthesis protein UbiJ
MPPMNNEEMEEIKRHFGVIAESLRSDIQLIAEGHDVIRRELHTQREELKEEFKETKSLVHLSYAQLDQRIDTVESDVSGLKSRVDRLESQG